MPSRFTKSSPTVSLAQMTVQPLHAMLMNTAEARGRGLSTTSTTSKIWDSRRYNVVSTSLFPQPLIYVQQIWISPVVQNIVASTSDGESYHGYWAQISTRSTQISGPRPICRRCLRLYMRAEWYECNFWMSGKQC